MHLYPNILRNSVVVYMFAKARTEYKKGVIKELFCEIGVFVVKKRSYMTFHRVKTLKMIWKTWSMTKKRSSELFVRENGNFFLKRSFRNLGLRKKIPSPPPNSAPGLRLWLFLLVFLL